MDDRVAATFREVMQAEPTEETRRRGDRTPRGMAAAGPRPPRAAARDPHLRRRSRSVRSRSSTTATRPSRAGI